MNLETNYSKNQIVKGIVTSIKKYGTFLSFEGGYVGLLHISEISAKFVNNIRNYFIEGDEIDVLILNVDEKTKFLTVSVKQLPDDLNPYLNIEPSKKLKEYSKFIDFSKLKTVLPKMIKQELEREDKND